MLLLALTSGNTCTCEGSYLYSRAYYSQASHLYCMCPLITLYCHPDSTQAQFDERPLTKESRRYVCIHTLYTSIFTDIIITSRSISDPKHPQPFVSGVQCIMSLMYTC